MSKKVDHLKVKWNLEGAVIGDKKFIAIKVGDKIVASTNQINEEVEAIYKLMGSAPRLLQSLVDVKSQLIDGGMHEESVTIMSIDSVLNDFI